MSSGVGNRVARNWPAGVHVIEWTVEDMCGNEETCETVIDVRDCKKPTPYCSPGLTTVAHAYKR